MSKKTENRKLEHIDICLKRDVNFKKSNGFEKISLEGTGREISIDEVDLSTEFLGKKFSYPVFIEAMTGGAKGTEKINENLAWAAERLGIGMGVGSQRAALENPQLEYTYKVRHVAPSIFLLGNIGGVQIVGYDMERIRYLVDMIDADGLAIHLNAFQELIQPEGDKKWEGVFEKIAEIASSANFPIIVKEVGSGICGWIAKRLEECGVSAIDVAGAGGTNWLKIEAYRGKNFHRDFVETGLPTAEALKQCAKEVSVPIIASGGMRKGEDFIKAIAMGASLVGMALPLLEPAMNSEKSVTEKVLKVIDEMKEYMAQLGVRNLKEVLSLRIVDAD